MPLIKAAQAPAAAPQAFSMKDIEQHARSLILRARQQSEQLLAAAQQEAELLKAQAQAEGVAEGRQEGLAKGLEEGRKAGQQQAYAEQKNQLTALVKTLTTAITEIDAQRRQIESEGLREAIELALAVARRVTKRQAEIDPEVLVENVGEAMKLVLHTAGVRIMINPAQRKALDAALPVLQAQWPGVTHVELVEDGGIAPGGCRIVSRGGEVDAQIDEQLRRVTADLLPDSQEATA